MTKEKIAKAIENAAKAGSLDDLAEALELLDNIMKVPTSAEQMIIIGAWEVLQTVEDLVHFCEFSKFEIQP